MEADSLESWGRAAEVIATNRNAFHWMKRYAVTRGFPWERIHETWLTAGFDLKTMVLLTLAFPARLRRSASAGRTRSISRNIPSTPGASETALFADINRDGKLDIVSGENWYEAPHWMKHHFREILYTNNYIDDLSTLPLDVDGDGHVDLVTSGWFSKKLAWWRNPGQTDALWEEHPIETGYPIEFAFLVDLDNDGKAKRFCRNSATKSPLAWYERDNHGGFVKHIVSPRATGTALAWAT